MQVGRNRRARKYSTSKLSSGTHTLTHSHTHTLTHSHTHTLTHSHTHTLTHSHTHTLTHSHTHTLTDTTQSEPSVTQKKRTNYLIMAARDRSTLPVILLNRYQWACQYTTICLDLGQTIDNSVQCEPSSVRIWKCVKHQMQLCNKHADYLNRQCPYHPGRKMKITLSS